MQDLIAGTIVRRFLAGLVAVTMLGVGWLWVSQQLSDPSVFLLLPEEGAQWIRFDEPANLVASRPTIVTTTFRKRLVIAAMPAPSVVTIRAFRQTAVLLDHQLVLTGTSDFTRWKSPLKLDLASRLAPGPHELRIVVMNQNGPAALLAYSQSLGLRTDESWEVSQDGLQWTPAVSVERFRPAKLSRLFPPVAQAFVAQLPFLAPLFLVVFCWTLLSDLPNGPRWMARGTPRASQIRWIALGAWSLLAINNAGKVPPYVGFDVLGHLDYIQYLARTGRVPLATEGWQMFQSPLYYALSAPLYRLSTPFFEPTTVIQILRAIPLLCGLAQVEVCFRVLRSVYPDRSDLQALGTVIGGFLPMNLYIAQSVGNEPLAGFLSAVVIALAIGILRTDQSAAPRRRTLILLGGMLGLALLAKVTAVLLIPPLVLLLWSEGWGYDRSFRRAASSITLVMGVAFVVCGWYYVRNWIELGKPFVGGWDPSRHIVWWQDPGYRTVPQFLTFGESLTYPIYAAVSGFWDAIFSTLWLDGFLSSMVSFNVKPPWNYQVMLSGAWLALGPTIGIVGGILLTLARPKHALHRGELFAVACLGLYYTALLVLYLQVPTYSTAKATYTLGVIPCYALMGAKGLGGLIRGPMSRAFIYATIACWAASAYFAYFVV